MYTSLQKKDNKSPRREKKTTNPRRQNESFYKRCSFEARARKGTGNRHRLGVKIFTLMSILSGKYLQRKFYLQDAHSSNVFFAELLKLIIHAKRR